MYPDLPDKESLHALGDCYRFYLVPGAAHCGSNPFQPGPYPQNNMETMIDWVEHWLKPSPLKATVSSGDYAGERQLLCQWPARPLWRKGSDSFDCVMDEKSIESWTYSFPAFKLPVY